MNDKTFDFILKKGEDYQTEFKENIGGMEKDLVAFANAEGGHILIGITDDNKVKGIEINNDLKAKIQDIARGCDLTITIKISEYKNVLIITVPESAIKPHRCGHGFYLRVGSISQKLSVEEIRDLFNKQGKLFFEEMTNIDFAQKDFDLKKFTEFIKKSNLSETLSTQELLARFELVNQKGEFKNAAILLFGKTPSKFIPQGIITCVLYKGTGKVIILDKKDFSSDILSNYTDTINFLYKNLRLRYEIKGFGPRKEILEIPEEALKEAIINAIVHRDYFEKGAVIQIDIFDDRVEISNPGTLLVKEADFGKKSISRNPLIFGLLQRIDLVEHVGSGIMRIRETISKAGLVAPKFEFTTFFTVIFYRPKLEIEIIKNKEWSEKWSEKWSENQRKLITYLEKNPKATRKELAKKIKINPSAIQKNLNTLKKQGKVKRIGSDKGGHWEIKK